MLEYNIDELIEKINIVDYVRQFVELEYSQGEWWGLCPLHSEKTPSFSINENMGKFYCQGCKVGGSIITFVSQFFKLSKKDAIEKLAIEYNLGQHHVSSLLKICKKWNPKKESEDYYQIKLKDDVMNKYPKEEIQEWIDEGISQSIMNEFQVRYDVENNRIVFPIWNNTGDIISLCGRTLDKDWRQKKLRKYTYYNKISCNNFFYAYYQHREKIESKNEIIIFEGAKSVWKAQGYGYENCVASVTDALSSEQVEELLKIPCKDVVIAWDKGVEYKHIKQQTHMLHHFKNIYLILDKGNLIDNKDSPVDRGKEVWETLYQNKVKI